MRRLPNNQTGFTLVEMIVVIVITGILGGMVAMFIRAPVQGYADSADTALRRLGRDIRTAVPNSIRVPVPGGINTYIEFLPTKAGGRYRAIPTGGAGNLCNGVTGNANGDALSFDSADTCFEIIGPPIVFAAGDQIVIGSTQSSGLPPYGSTYAGIGIRRTYTAGTGAQSIVVMAGAERFPAFAEVTGQRFDVVDGTQMAVTYACINGTGTNASGDGVGKLMRYSGYGFLAGQPVPPLAGGSILADKISACEISYDTVNQRSGLVAIRLAISRGGESISLYHEIHVNNIP
jgi:MSHA biogenesis protein MshO